MSSFPNQYPSVPAPLIPSGIVLNSMQTTSVVKNVGQDLVNKVQSMTGNEALALIPNPVVGQMVFITVDSTDAGPTFLGDYLYVKKASAWVVIP
jgi:hypothetical protein